LTEDDVIARDLFGEPVAAVRAHGRKRRVTPNVEEGFENKITLSTIRLRLPARYSFDGLVLGSPLRQLANKAGQYEGVLERVQLKRLLAYRFSSPSREPFLIVTRKTLTDSGGEALLLVRDAEDERAIQEMLERGEGTWLSPRPRRPSAISVDEASAICHGVLNSWRGQFTCREGNPATESTPEVRGLRKPQVGALYAALSHATSSRQPASIIMPTGTGKTETMLAIYAHDRISRLMVVVPTDALRDQIADKMETMGVLQDQLCLTSTIKFPAVLRLQHIPKNADEVDELFLRANVIITTMSIAGRAESAVQERMAQMCGALFIDEAHHIKAKTWREFRAWFVHAAEEKTIYQFTATPFREDGGKVDGKLSTTTHS
jgi:hypothetical protein